MAETTTTIEAIKIDTAPSVKSLADLKKEIKDMKAQLLSLDKTSEEYNQLLTEIGNKQHALKEINEEVTRTNNDFGQSMSNVSGTLAGVSGAIQTVTGVLSLMGVEAGKDSKLLKVMVSAMSITAGIQAVDAGVKSMRALTVTIKTATVASGGLGKALKALAYSNPFTAILAAATAVITVIASIVSKTREATAENYAQVASVDALVNSYYDLGAAAGSLKGSLDWAKDTATQKSVEKLLGKFKEFEKETGNFAIDNEKTWRQFYAEIQKNGSASEKQLIVLAQAEYNYQQAVAATGNLRRENYATDLDFYMAQNNHEQVVQKLEAKRVAEYQKLQQERKNNAKNSASTAKVLQDALTRQHQNELSYLQKEIKLVEERYMEKGEGNYIPQLLALYDLQLEKEKEAIDAKVKAKEITAEQGEIDKRIAEQKHAADTQAIEDVQTLTRAKEADKQVTLLEADYQQKQYEAQKAYYTQELQWYSQLADSRTTELQTVQIESQQSEAEYQRTMSQMTDRIALLQQYLTLYAEQPDKMAEVQQEISDLQQEMTSVEQEQAKKRIDIAKKEAEAKKNINKKYLQAYQSVSGSVSSVLGSMSDSMEEGTQQWKNLKIAQAIIDTLAGSVTAFTSAMELGVPLGPIVGAAEMAAVLATGFATVAQIKNTQVNKDSAGGGSMPSITVNDQAVNALTNQASNVRLTNTDNDIIDLGEQLKQVKVVVSAREITDTQEDMKRVKVANTF